MTLDAASDPRWSSFNDATALVRAKHPQLLNRFRRGARHWVETELLMDLPKATWSGADIEIALAETAKPKRGRREEWNWKQALVELERRFSLDESKTVLASALQQIIADREGTEPGFSSCQKRVSVLIASRHASGKNRP